MVGRYDDDGYGGKDNEERKNEVGEQEVDDMTYDAKRVSGKGTGNLKVAPLPCPVTICLNDARQACVTVPYRLRRIQRLLFHITQGHVITLTLRPASREVGSVVLRLAKK